MKKKQLLFILTLLFLLAANVFTAQARKIPHIILCWDKTKVQCVLYFYGIDEGSGSLPQPSGLVVLKTYSDPEVTLKDWNEQPEWVKDLRSNAFNWVDERGLTREVQRTRSNDRSWVEYAMVFDSSFRDVRPTSTAYWFAINNLDKPFDIKGFENLNTSEVTNMNGMFKGYWDLELDLSTMDTRKVKSMRLMFSDTFSNGYEGKLDLSHFDTSNVTDMSLMFDECDYPGYIDASHFNTSNVTNMSHMFGSCYKATGVNVSSFNTSNVTNMSYMFDNCHSLQSLDVSNFDTGKVTNMRNMFNRCYKITSLDLHNFNTSNVTDMGEMISEMSALTSVDLSSFDTRNVKGMAYMFYGDESLTTLDLSSFNTSKVTYMTQMFENSDRLTRIYVSDDWTTASVNTEYGGDDMFLNCKAITGEFGQTYDKNKVNYNMAFCGPGGYLWHKDSPHSTLTGDANGDGKVDAADIVEIVKYLNGHPSAKFNQTNADANGMGGVTAEDIKAVVGIILSK